MEPWKALAQKLNAIYGEIRGLADDLHDQEQAAFMESLCQSLKPLFDLHSALAEGVTHWPQLYHRSA